MFFLFFPLGEEFLIATSLEFLIFHPSNPKMNEKFNFAVVNVGDVRLSWCTFPKEFKEVCEKAAKTFKMKMENTPRVMVLSEEKVQKKIQQ
jgi:hypothetical protein